MVTYRSLNLLKILLSLIKKAPNSPQTRPRHTQHSKSASVLVTLLKKPNFIADVSDKLTGYPFAIDLISEEVQVAIEVQTKIRHNILKVQKVVGTDIS